MLFYAYKTRTMEGAKYVLLGQAPQSVSNYQDLRRTILGWVRYEVEGERENVMLWNTQMGLRPLREGGVSTNRQPLVFPLTEEGLAGALQYNQMGHFGPEIHLIVNDKRLRSIRRLSPLQAGYQWLPMPETASVPDFALGIGVVGEPEHVQYSDGPQVTPLQLPLVLLIDATHSMDVLWQNLGPILKSTLRQLAQKDLQGPAGDRLEVQIGVFYYYQRGSYRLNQESWIVSEADVDHFQGLIDGIDLRSSALYPDIQSALGQVIDEVGQPPLVLVVIGDAGDRRHSGSLASQPDLRSFSESPLFSLFGLRFDSRFWYASPYIADPAQLERVNLEVSKEDYQGAFLRFGTNFDLLYDIRSQEITPDETETIAGVLSQTLERELEGFVQSGLAWPGTKSVQPSPSAGLPMATPGSTNPSFQPRFFQEGVVLLKDRNGQPLLEVDVLLTKQMVSELLEACQVFRTQENPAGFKQYWRNLIAVAYQMDYRHVDDAFLGQTTVDRFWIQLLGDRGVIERVKPELLADRRTFLQIVGDWAAHQAHYIPAIRHLEDQLRLHLEQRRGYIPVQIDLAKGIISDYYWVPVDFLQVGLKERAY